MMYFDVLNIDDVHFGASWNSYLHPLRLDLRPEGIDKIKVFFTDGISMKLSLNIHEMGLITMEHQLYLKYLERTLFFW